MEIHQILDSRYFRIKRNPLKSPGAKPWSLCLFLCGARPGWVWALEPAEQGLSWTPLGVLCVLFTGIAGSPLSLSVPAGSIMLLVEPTIWIKREQVNPSPLGGPWFSFHPFTFVTGEEILVPRGLMPCPVWYVWVMADLEMEVMLSKTSVSSDFFSLGHI